MPQLAAELRSIDFTKLLKQREAETREEKGNQLGDQHGDINQKREDDLDEYIADLAESADKANPELG